MRGDGAGALHSPRLLPGARSPGSSGGAREWDEIADRSSAIADASSGLTGNALKDLIYDRLAALMDRPHRETIQ